MTSKSNRVLILDIDGTLTRPTGDGIDPQIFEPILKWDGPVIFATGMSFPYPVALAHFIGVQKRVVAENGGVVFNNGDVFLNGDNDAPKQVLKEYEATGRTIKWGPCHPLNRWRETEIILSLDQDLSLLKKIAKQHNLTVVDTGYAYHIKRADLNKGKGVINIMENIGAELSNAVAIGDSVNDVSVFEIVDKSFAVANADSAAKNAANVVLSESHANGTVSVLNKFL